MIRLYRPLGLILFLAACAAVPQDVAQGVYATDATFTSLAPFASAAIQSGKLSTPEVTGVKTASQEVHDALNQATSALAACPQTAGKVDTTCANGSVISAAWSAAKGALDQIIATLAAHGLSTGG